jgi:hypothetical protein
MQRGGRLEQAAFMLLGLALPHWVLTLKYPTRSTCLCYPWLVSRLFMHDLRESTLHHSLCCGLIESRNIHDEYCIKQAILTEVSTSIKDLRARGLHAWEHQSRLTPRIFFSRREALPPGIDTSHLLNHVLWLLGAAMVCEVSPSNLHPVLLLQLLIG